MRDARTSTNNHRTANTESQAGHAHMDKQRLKVLIVEDDTHYFSFVKCLLVNSQELHFEVIEATNLADGRRLLQWESPDIILLDLNLPDSDGLSTLKRVSAIAGGCPIVVLTGSDDQSLGLQAMAMGAQDYVVKQQIGCESLIRCIRYAVERRRSEEATLRLSVIRDFMGALAHDLQSPLIGADRVIDGLLRGESRTLDASVTKMLLSLKASNEKQLSLVRRLLEVYRYEAAAIPLDHKELCVKELITAAVERASRIHANKIPLTLKIAEGLANISGDREALLRVLDNFLDNAVTFGDGSSPITIKAETAHDKLAISVHNFGQAIDDSVQASLFKNFWNGVPGKRYVARTGFGLYLCQRIAHLHGGRIHCESSEENGTVVTVVLPLG